MKIRSLYCLSILSALGFLVVQSFKCGGPTPITRLPLREGWVLQSSAHVAESGEVISTVQYQPKNWYPVSVPATVVAALVKNKIYPDPFFGMNLRSIPGTEYRIGVNFSNVAMPKDSPFAAPWWYRKEFALPVSYRGKTIRIYFGGINYRADIWLNGTRIAAADEVAGSWRTYEFDITSAALPGKSNVLAVLVYAPLETDLAITFVDWNPQPPDKNMGLWRGVEVTAGAPVVLRYPAVFSKVNVPINDRAQLTITALLKNAANRPMKGLLRGQIESIRFSQEIELKPAETREVILDPERYTQLIVANPRLWWPAQMGVPERYTPEHGVRRERSCHRIAP